MCTRRREVARESEQRSTRSIQDPDGGTSETTYDLLGNVATTLNARGKTTTHSYDAIGRPLFIDRPNLEKDITFSYRAGERGMEKESTSSYSQTHSYDDMGRLAQKKLVYNGIGSQTLLLDFDYDELGRTTDIVYPHKLHVRYEHQNEYLTQVCELDTGDTSCSDPDVTFFANSIEYDTLGRREQVVTPAGVRTFEYSPTDQRMTRDLFDGVTPPGGTDYVRDLAYAGYDGLGNVTVVDATGSSGGALDFSAQYTYDNRNRIASWQRDGETLLYDYDTLGNLTTHQVPTSGSPNRQPDLRPQHQTPRHHREHDHGPFLRLRRRRQPVVAVGRRHGTPPLHLRLRQPPDLRRQQRRQLQHAGHPLRRGGHAPARSVPRRPGHHRALLPRQPVHARRPARPHLRPRPDGHRLRVRDGRGAGGADEEPAVAAHRVDVARARAASPGSMPCHSSR